MALGKKVCKVCGREYEACHTLRPNLNSEFRWQDVACCPEHGQEYLRKIMIARGQIPVDTQSEEKKTRSRKRTVKKDNKE